MLVSGGLSTRTIGIAILAGIIVYSVFSGRGNGPGENRTAKPSRLIPVDEAYLILGLTPGVARDEVISAYRHLMKRLHPDQGGAVYLAAQVIGAKDILCGISGISAQREFRSE